MFDDYNKPAGPSGQAPDGNAAIWPRGTEPAGSNGLAETAPASGFGQAQDKRSVVEDILAGAESAPPEKPAVFRPKEQVEPAYELTEESAASSSHAIKKIFFLLVVLAVLGLVVALGYFGYKMFLANDSAETTIAPPEEEVPAAENVETPPPAAPEPAGTEQPPAQPADSDNDGLTDAEEQALGLNINSVDSDGDGLFDREEVMVYKTNPLLSDTDGDGFLDGAEVKAGYNPNGAGRLYDINQ